MPEPHAHQSGPFAYRIGTFANTTYTVVSYQPIGSFAWGYYRNEPSRSQ